MLLTTLPRLCCPTYIDGINTCSGELSVEIIQKKSIDVLFGTLICKLCKANFPILAGIAVLVNDVEEYLQIHAKGVSAIVKDSEIPEIYVESYLAAKEAIISGFTEDDLESQKINALYYMSHYMSTKKKNFWWRPKRDSFSIEIDRLMKNHWDRGPFAKIAEWTKKLKNQNVVELGCGVGGVARLLDRSIASYLGVDSAFTSIALARHIHLSGPYSDTIKIPQDLYQGALSAKVVREFPLKIGKVDFVVGEIENLPVVKEQFDLTIALSTIDMIENPSDLPRLQFELLIENGIAIQSSPYIWHEMVAENLRKILPKKIHSSSGAVEYLYENSGLKIFKKIDHLPWLFLKHFREVGVYSVHLFAAKKVKKK